MNPANFLRLVDNFLLFPVVGIYNFLVYITSPFKKVAYPQNI